MSTPHRDAFAAPSPRFRTSTGWWLGLIVLAGLALRLWRALHADWYWDEGYLSEVSWDLAHGLRPHSGALWFNGLLPLTCSWLAPLSVAPLHWLLPGSALWAVRVWGCLLDALSLWAVGRIGRQLGGAWVGLSAALILALGPLPVALGALGIYHHLGSALALLAWAATLDDREDAPAWLPYLLAGLSAAACFWLWWVALGLLLWRPPRPLGWLLRGALALGPLALALGLILGLGGPNAWAMARVLGAYTAPWRGPGLLWTSARDYPLAWGGLALLAVLPKGRRWAWVVWLGLADAVRQRGDLHGSPYLLLVLLPWACLGVGLGLRWLALRSRVLAGLALLLALGSASVGSTDWIERFSTPPPLGRNLVNFLRTRSLGQGTVVASPDVGWALRAVCRPVELSQAAAARGWGGGFLPARLSPAAFAYDPRLESAHCLVVDQTHFDSLFLDPRQALEALAAEAQGWPLVFKNPAFVVYANPRYGVRPDPAVRILHDPVFYWRVACFAQQHGRPAWAAFARARARAGFVP